MTHASLFSGIGGFDLAAEWMGWQNTFNCEIDPFCRKVLAYHFPEAKQYEDVKTTGFTIHRGHIDVLTGGFPCQPFSLAGKRKGADDNRYLWPEMLRAIREIQPRWVVGENVFGIVNWSDGLVFEQVQSDLENEGYEVQPYIIPACAVDAPHRRDRVWFVAHRRDAQNTLGDGFVQEPRNREEKSNKWQQRMPCAGDSEWICDEERIITSDGSHAGQSPRSPRQRPGEVRRADSRVVWRWDFSKFPTQSPVCGGDDGLSDRLDACPVPGWLKVNKRWRFSGWWRRESIKAYGNAVVPQIPYLIFEAITQYDLITE